MSAQRKPCPYCGRTITYEEVNGVQVFGHAMPRCEQFATALESTGIKPVFEGVVVKSKVRPS